MVAIGNEGRQLADPTCRAGLDPSPEQFFSINRRRNQFVLFSGEEKYRFVDAAEFSFDRRIIKVHREIIIVSTFGCERIPTIRRDRRLENFTTA